MVTQSATALLRAQGLGFAYGAAPVLEDVSLELRPGVITGIIGPNGSGKSTLMGILSGLLKPAAGRVLIKGEPLGGYSRRGLAHILGLVPQAPQIAYGVTVLDTVLAGRYALMGGRLFENADDRRAAQAALDQAGLNHLAGRPAGELSGGERQRLALARALACTPEILLLDEPTSALDLKHQLKLMALLERYTAGAGRTVCLVSHDLNLAGMFCGQLMLLSKGRVIAQGAAREVLIPGMIKAAYGVEALVDPEPTRGRPRVTLVPKQTQQ